MKGWITYMICLKCAFLFCMPLAAQNTALQDSADAWATKDFRKAIALCDSMLSIKNLQPEARGAFTRIKGKALYFNGSYEKASLLYAEAVALLGKAGNPRQTALTLNEQAKLYRKTRMLDAAEKTYQRALDIFTSLHDSSNIAMILNESGVVYEYAGDYDKAINNYTQSLRLQEALKDTIGIAYASNFIAGASLIKKDYAAAEQYAFKAYGLFKKKGDAFAATFTASDIARIFIEAKQWDSAMHYVRLSNSIAESMQFADLAATNYSLIAEIFQQEKKWDSAFHYQKAYSLIRDSLFNNNTQKTIAELNTKYETAQKDNALLEQQAALNRNKFMLAALGALLLAGAGFFLFYFQRTRMSNLKKMQAAVLHEQHAAAIAVMNAEEAERHSLAATLHDGLGQMLSAIRMNLQSLESRLSTDSKAKCVYDKTLSLTNDAMQEVRAISHRMLPAAVMRSGLNIALQQMTDKLQNDALEVQLNISGDVPPMDQRVQLVLYRIFQECISNVLKHAAATRLFINLEYTHHFLYATIEDNGKGFDAQKPNSEAGIGLSNVASRIAFLKGTLDVSSLPGAGTTVAFHVPLR